MTFPPHAPAPAVEQRAETWAGLGVSVRTFAVQPNHGKPVARVELESAAWLVGIIVWSTGEAEVDAGRVSDGRVATKHYDLTDRGDLEVLLDELVRLLVRDEIPDAAVVHHPCI